MTRHGKAWQRACQARANAKLADTHRKRVAGKRGVEEFRSQPKGLLSRLWRLFGTLRSKGNG